MIPKMLWHSLFEDLTEYLDLPYEVLRDKLTLSHQNVVDHWNAASPKTRQDREQFYEDTDTYLLELAAWILDFETRQTWNHQVSEFARQLGLKTALDFGAGISNEGLQLAQDGLDVHLCEVNPISRNFAVWRAQKHDLVHKIKLADESTVARNRYDLGILLDVIGHVEEPIDLIIDLARRCQYVFYSEDFQIEGGQWPMHTEKPANFDRVMNGVWRNLHGNFWESRLYHPKFSLSPSLKDFGNGEGGVKRQIEALYKLLPAHGIEVNDAQADFSHNHATGDDPRLLIYTSHGFYPWTTTNPTEKYINAILKQNIAAAKRIISVSDEAKAVIEEKWGKPVTLIRNGVFLDQLDSIPSGQFRRNYDIPDGPFFLWSKNSVEGVCDPTPALELARLLPQYTFVFTLINIANPPPNVRVVGTLPHVRMLQATKDCAVYLGTTKEQFSVGTLEAMGMGKPVLCFPEGGNGKVVEHRKDGYIASELADLVEGAKFCLQYREALGRSAREKVEEQYTWERLVPRIVALYWEAIEEWIEDLKRPLVSVVIPHYNLARYLPETLDSVLAQTVANKEVLVVDDGSTDDISSLEERYTPLGVRFLRQRNAGVSMARNRGIEAAAGRYVCCLDADDRIDPSFLAELTSHLEANRRIGIAYTNFELFGDQRGVVKSIPYDFERLKEGNYIPCCNVFRREAWETTGGYKNINPSWEDYELWLNMGKMGFVGKHIDKPLFLYRKRNQQGRDFSSHGHEARLRATVNSYHPDLYLPKLSVVIPTYKHTHYLPEVLNSIKRQTYHDFEVIIVDDGNDDWAKINQVAEQFSTEFPLRVVRHEKNRGLAAARNTGVEASRGVYILTLDADDLIHPSFMERTVGVLDERPDIAIAYTDMETFGAMNRVMEMPDYDYDLLLEKNLMACASPYRREVWDKVGGYKTDMIYGWEDYLFWIEAGRKGFCGIRIPEVLFKYRRVGESMILRAQKHVNEMRRQLREHVPDVFRGERPMACCGRTRLMSAKQAAAAKRSFVSQSPAVGEYALVRLHYKGDHIELLRTAVTGSFFRKLEGGQNIYVDPRDVPQLLSRGDFEYSLEEELEEALA